MFQPNNSQKDPISKLIFEFSKLPGVGEKTATRLAHFILKQNLDYAKTLSQAVLSAKERTSFCGSCFTFTEVDPCPLCSHPERENGILCVVEKPTDVHSIEGAGVFRGRYHVLHGALSPLDGVGPEELKIKELLERIQKNNLKEVILATNPSVEGEATALFLARLLKPFKVKITQLAHGLPMGGFIEYVDKQTLSKALNNRMEMQLT